MCSMPSNIPSNGDHSDPVPQEIKDMNVLALVKDDERYIFLYDDQSRSEVLRTFGRFAANEDLSFNWYDAGVLLQKVRRLAQDAMQADPFTTIARPESEDQ